MYRIASVGLLLSLLACRPDQPAGVPPEVALARHEAARDACISAEILTLARDNLSTLAQMHGLDDPEVDPQEVLLPGPMEAAYRYAHVYHHHAELRHTAYAYADSALNHSRTATDSARYARTAAGVVVAPPAPGTLEGNVAEAYSRAHSTIRNDEDHPCNWAI